MHSSAHAATGTWTGGAGATWDTTTTNWLNLTGTPWDLTNGGTNAAVFNTLNATSTVSGMVYANAITFTNTATISGGTISLAGTTPTITTSANGIISSILTGASGLTKAGAATLTLTGSNTYSGTTNITAGVVNIQNASALGGTAQGTTVAAGAQLQLQGGITVTGESLSINASGVNALLNISGNNTWAGAITADGVASFPSNGDLTAYNRIESGNGSLLTLSGPITIAAPAASGTASGLLVLGAGNMVISGAISGGKAGNISFVSSSNGAGTRTLSGSNSYLGWTSVNGNLTLEGGNAIPDTSRVVSNATSMRLVLNASETIGGLAASAAGAQINLNANTLTIGADNTTPGAGDLGGASYQGTIIGTGGITKIGTATLTLAGASTYSGTTAINNGTLRLSNQNAAQNSTVTMGGGSLVFDSSVSGNAFTFGGLSGTASGAGFNLALQNNLGTPAAVALTVGGNNASTAFAGVLSGAGSLTKTGAGTLTLSGSNTYSGVTSVNAGTLRLSSTGALYGGNTASWTAANLTTGSGATTAFAVGGASGFTSANLDTLRGLGTGSTGFLPGSSFGIDTTGTAFTYASNIGNPNGGVNAMGLAVLGSGTLVLSGSNTYTGATSVNAGVLNVGSANALVGGGTISFGGGALQYSASNNTDYSSRIKNSSGAITIDTNGQNVTFGAVFDSTNTGGFTKLGSGTLTMSSGSSSFTGPAAISAGAVTVNATTVGSPLFSANSITVAAGATLTANVSNSQKNPLPTSAPYTINGSLVLATNGNGQDLLNNTITLNNATVSHSGAIGQYGFLYLSGVTFSATGTSTISSGASLGLNGSNVVDTPNAVDRLTISAGIGASNAQALGGRLTKTGSGTLVLTGANIYTGTTSINAGTLQIGNGSTTGGLSASSAITGSAGATLAFNRSNTVTQGTDFNAAIGGAVRVAQNGTGTLVLNGSNSYTGGTVVSSGILTAGTTSALGTGTATVNGGTLQYATPMPSVAATVVNNGGTLAVRVGGSGFTSGNLDQLFSGTGGTTLNSGAMVALDTTSGNFTYSSVVSGNTGIQKIGSSSLLLSSTNTYLGVTRISAGALNTVVFADGGVASGIGLSSNAASNLVIETGGQINGSGTTDRLFTLGTSGQAWVGSSGAPLVFTNTGTIAVSGSATHNLRLSGNVGGNRFAPVIIDFNASNPTSFSVQNTNWLITATASTYTGRTNIDADGTLVASSLADGGLPSSIGASSNAAANLVFGFDAFGGNNTLRYAGAAAASTDRLFTLGSLLGAGVVTTIDNAGEGTLNFTNTGSIVVSSTASTMLAFTGSNAINFAPVIVNGSGTVGLTKNGTNTLTLTGSNTYSGATTVSAGQLQIGSAGSINSTSGITVNGSGAEFKYNSATALSKPLTLTRGSVSGTGTINTPVAIGTNVTLSPGNSPGTQTYQSGTFASGGTYAWEINNWTSGTAGVNFDQAVFTSGLAITSSSASPFTINLVSLKADNSTGAVPGFNSGLTGLSFAIATGTMTGYSPNVFALGTSSFLSANTVSGSANGGFWLSTNSGSDQLILNYAPSARYTLSATPAAPSIRTGSSTVITGAITSSTADRTGADSMAFSGLSVGTGSLSTTSGTLLSGSSASGTVTYTGTAAGQFTFTPSVSSATNVNLGSNALAGTVTSGTVTVWNPAVATISGSVNLGTVIVGASSLSQALSITNSAPTGGYSESLNASFGTLSGVTMNSGSIALLAAGSTDSAAMIVSLATNTVGNLTGSAQINFATDGQGTSGLAAAALSPQTVNVYGTVLDHATPGFLGVLDPLATGTLALNFGSVDETAGPQSLTFSLTNLAALAGADLTAGLALTGTGTELGSGFSLSGAGFSNLIAGGTSGLFTVGFTPLGQGSFSQTFKLSFSDNQSLAGAAARRDLFVAANVIVVPEPRALALVGIGMAAAAWALRRRM